MKNVENYIWVFLPPDPARAQVRAMQQELHDRFGLKKAMRPPVHISLPADAPTAAEEADRLIEVSRAYAARSAPIAVELTGFQAFGNRTISLRIRDAEPFRNFWRPFREKLMAGFGFSADDLTARINPHVTVAFRDLTPLIFDVLWPELQRHDFQASFTLHALQLYKYGPFRQWIHVAELPLLGKSSPKMEQGTLFQMP